MTKPSCRQISDMPVDLTFFSLMFSCQCPLVSIVFRRLTSLHTVTVTRGLNDRQPKPS